MSNAIYILLDAGWDPLAYNCWVDTSGDKWILTDSSASPNIVASALAKSRFNVDLIRASSHYCGQGIENGIDYNATVAVLRSKQAKNYKFKCAVETLIAAGSWPALKSCSIA